MKWRNSTSPTGNKQPSHQRSGYQKLPLARYSVADSTWEERAVCYFFDQYTTVDRPDECVSHLGFLPSLYAICRDGKQDGSAALCLRLAVDATALISLGNQVKAPSLILKGRRSYGMALRGLQRALTSLEQAVKDETFTTMVLLSLFEDINGERNGLVSSHTAGFEFLMKLRGESQLGNPQGRDLFSFAYAQTHIEILALREMPRHNTDWIVGGLDSSDPVARLILMSSKISQVIVETSSFQGPLNADGAARLSAWLQSSQIVDLEFSSWDQRLPDNWLPQVVLTPKGESLLTYQQMGIAVIWTYYRAVRIILQQLILQLRGTIKSLVGDDEVTQDGIEVRVIRKMITDSCRSIPFCFGDIDARGNPIPSSSEGKPRVRAVYGYSMLWPLWYMLSCGLATPAQSAQLRGALAQVGSALGIKLALILVGDGTPRSAPSGLASPMMQPGFGQFI
ncbi:Zn(II)2Cys6 transcription factor [Aspergillus terreus]|uniref:Zn(II)2Cys6 transcription factor n=1 Tax=Aspergillus terreus TaxID=33178 RepID=A0A5M3YLH2_ASPTE|nr:hypothetical protein ATETN484_0001026500 [Aspergillus terreus]GFF12121.1 Zn(II)2Cys6 transcription factor [Aspergillus terreus]